MAETVKKSATPAKPRKAATRKKTANSTEAVPQAQQAARTLPHDQVAQLAHKYWVERGHQHGHHEEDWYRAERELRGQA